MLSERTGFLPKATAIILAILGLVLGGGGAWLAFLGGSGSYVGCGLVLLVAAGLLLPRRRSALRLSAALVFAVLGWSAP